MGSQERGHERRQPVVVAEARPQLLDAHGVVFIDDGDRTVVEQGAQGVADIEVAGPVLEVVRHQQHLRGVAALGAEHSLVGFDQAALPDRGHGLKVGEFLRPLGEPHPAHAGPDGSRTDEHHLPPLREDGVELAPERLDARVVEQPVRAGEHAGADLDDDEPGGGGEIQAERVGHGPVVEVREARGRVGERSGMFQTRDRGPASYRRRGR
jgi:hypothetical protein